MGTTRRRIATTTLTAAALLAVVPAAGLARQAPDQRRAVVDPTPLRLVTARAARVIGDGEQFVVVVPLLASGRQTVVHDTVSGRRAPLPAGCRLAGSAGQTTVVTAGRALLLCGSPSRYRVLNLANGDTIDLPAALTADGMQFTALAYGVLGRRWVSADVDCPGAVACATAYYDLRSGATSLSRDRGIGLGTQQFFDLDTAGLPLRRVCRPTIDYDPYVRHYQPPYYVDRDVGLRRCGDGRLVQRFAAAGGDVTADLTAAGLAWGTTVPDESTSKPSPYVNLYEPGRARLLRWRLPPLDGRRAFGAAVVVTRCELFALTSRSFGDRGGAATSFRVHRAELPAPRPARCRR